MKKIIISGINGQLGQFFAKYILEKYQDIKVIGTVRHKSYDDQFWIFDRNLITIELMDLTDAHSIENLIVKHKPDYFINTAANAFVGESWAVPVQHIEQNTIGVLHQLEAIRKHSPLTRYANLGTSEEFACSEISGPQNENTKIAPKSPYGCSKAASRYLIDTYKNSYNLYALQPWCFNFESELRGEKYVTGKICKGVARIYHALKNNKGFEPISLGNIYSNRSWQFAQDVADGIFRMLNQENYRQHLQNDPIIINGKYNSNVIKCLKNYCFSESKTHDIKEFINLAFNEAGIKGVWWNLTGKPEDEEFLLSSDGILATKKKISLIKIDPKFYRPLDVTFLYGDATAARTELNWESSLEFNDLVKRMTKWHIENFK